MGSGFIISRVILRGVCWYGVLTIIFDEEMFGVDFTNDVSMECDDWMFKCLERMLQKCGNAKVPEIVNVCGLFLHLIVTLVGV